MVIISGASMGIKLARHCNSNSTLLLLELPQEIANTLIITSDGTIDAGSLVNALQMIENEALSFLEHIELMANIFDESRAVDFNHPTLRQ